MFATKQNDWCFQLYIIFNLSAHKAAYKPLKQCECVCVCVFISVRVHVSHLSVSCHVF